MLTHNWQMHFKQQPRLPDSGGAGQLMHSKTVSKISKANVCCHMQKLCMYWKAVHIGKSCACMQKPFLLPFSHALICHTNWRMFSLTYNREMLSVAAMKWKRQHPTVNPTKHTPTGRNKGEKRWWNFQKGRRVWCHSYWHLAFLKLRAKW